MVCLENNNIFSFLFFFSFFTAKQSRKFIVGGFSIQAKVKAQRKLTNISTFEERRKR
jgi:hypothetical protein